MSGGRSGRSPHGSSHSHPRPAPSSHGSSSTPTPSTTAQAAVVNDPSGQARNFFNSSGSSSSDKSRLLGPNGELLSPDALDKSGNPIGQWASQLGWSTAYADTIAGRTWTWVNGGDQAATLFGTQQVKPGLPGQVMHGSDATGWYSAPLARSKSTGGKEIVTSGPVVKSADDVVNAFDLLFKTNPQRAGEIQRMLDAANLYSNGVHPRIGIFSFADEAAFVGAMAASAKQQMPLEDYLNKAAAAGPGIGSAPTKPAEVDIYTNPLDVAATADKGNSSQIGRNYTPQEMANFLQYVHDGEYQAQHKAYVARGGNAADPTYDPTTGVSHAGPGGAVTAAPADTANTLMEYNKQQHPAEYLSTQMGENAAAALRALNSQSEPGSSFTQ